MFADKAVSIMDKLLEMAIPKSVPLPTSTRENARSEENSVQANTTCMFCLSRYNNGASY